MTEYTNQGISVTSQCYDCMMLDDVCLNCEESKEAKDSAVAHQLVDEGNMQYERQMSWLREAPAGHDWVGSTTRVEPYFSIYTLKMEDTREEYKESTTQLQDGGTYEELWELDDMRQRSREVECQWCHLLTPKAFNQCQDCDGILEHNVR